MTTTIDHELAAVLICLAPLGGRGRAYVNTTRREFDYRAMLDAEGWSSGERAIITAAGGLWNRADAIDLAYLTGLSGDFFLAFVNAVAALRGQDFCTSWRTALHAIEDEQ